MIYTFTGLTPFIQRAARADPLVSEPHLLKCEGIWHVSQIQNALGQLPRLDPTKRGELWDHVKRIRQGLAATLAGIDAAIAEVAEHCPAEVEPAADRKAIKAPARRTSA